jgi:hypothetical protein
VALAARHAGPETTVLVFDDATGKVIDLDLRGGDAAIRRRYQPVEVVSSDPNPERPRGRPKLGVVAREITLLPRHWAWLGTQPGGASVALRKLVEAAQRAGANRDRVRAAKEAAYRFMSAMAGDAPGFEEATRALFAGDRVRFTAQTADWPSDVRDHARRLAAAAFDA